MKEKHINEDATETEINSNKLPDQKEQPDFKIQNHPDIFLQYH